MKAKLYLILLFAVAAPILCNAQTGVVFKKNGYELWISDSTEVVKGLISCTNYFSGAQMFDDTKYRALASKLGLGLYRYPSTFYPNYKEKATAAINYLDTLATLSGHSEIAYTCLIPTGLSSAGWDVTALIGYFPKRIIAAFPVAGFGGDIIDSVEAIKIPVCGVNQGEDQFYPGSGVNTLDDIEKGRSKLAPWTFQITVGCSHDSWCRMDWMELWIEDICKLRIPDVVSSSGPVTLKEINDYSTGWLGKLWAKDHVSSPKGAHWRVDSVKVWQYNQCPYDPKVCFWFPSQKCAEEWKNYHAPIFSPSSFNAEVLSASKIKLTWSDYTSNVSGYKIERQNHFRIYLLVANLESNIKTYIDSTLSAETNCFYRISAYNNYGSSDYSFVTAKTSNENTKIYPLTTDYDLKIYPNPNNGCFYIDCLNIPKISIVNIEGRELPFFMVKEENRTQINIEELPNGVYFIKANGLFDYKIVKY